MVETRVCKKCGKKAEYFRPAFGSWRCSQCGIETHVDTPDHAIIVRVADEWWRSLTNDQRIKLMNENRGSK